MASAARRVKAARLRLGMCLHDGREIVEIVRPSPDTVSRGYGRVWVEFARDGRRTGIGWNYYPDALVELADGDDTPEDLTMDDWKGRWW